MQLSNEKAPVATTTWVNITSPYNWDLSAAKGTKTVYVIFKARSGKTSSAVSDSIELTVPPGPNKELPPLLG